MLIRGGTVVNPARDLRAERDIRVADGRVTVVAERLTPRPGDDVIDARDLV